MANKSETIYDRGVVKGPIDVLICGELIPAYERLSISEKLIARVCYHIIYNPIITSLYLKAARKIYGKNLEKALM